MYAAGKNNFYALIACIFNPRLTSNDALSLFDIPLGTEMRLTSVNRVKKITRPAKTIDINAIRVDYEKGMNTLELSIKYKISKVRAAESIRQAGGTMRSRGSKKWQ